MENTTENTMGTGATAVRLTELETKTMHILFDSADGNGHDFGFIDDLIDAKIMGRNQVSGVVSSLVKKGIIEDWGEEKVNWDSSYTQFTWGKQCGFGPNVNDGWDRLPDTISQFFTMFNILPALVSFEGLRQNA